VTDGELAWVRLELDLLTAALRRAPLSLEEMRRYEALTARERELLAVVPSDTRGRTARSTSVPRSPSPRMHIVLDD
jgi:hypothetical protein